MDRDDSTDSMFHVFQEMLGRKTEYGPICYSRNLVAPSFVIDHLFRLHVVRIPITFHVNSAGFAEERKIAYPVGFVGL